MTVTPTSDLSSFLSEDPGLSRLYDNVQAVIPGTILSQVKMHAWNTIEEFYQRSTVERRYVNWQMAIGVQSVDFNPYDETWLVSWVLSLSGLYRWEVIPPGKVQDLMSPDNIRHGRALLALTPVAFAAEMPHMLMSQWFETVLDGTLARFFNTPAKPYSSPQLAQYHQRRYYAGISRARAFAQQQNTDGPGRWGFPYFAGGKRKN